MEAPHALPAPCIVAVLPTRRAARAHGATGAYGYCATPAVAQWLLAQGARFDYVPQRVSLQ